jgi:hypothetical protein
MAALGLTLRMNVYVDGYAEHRQTARCGDRANTGQCRHALANPRIDIGAGSAAPIRRRRQSQEIRQNATRIVAEVGCPYGNSTPEPNDFTS